MNPANTSVRKRRPARNGFGAQRPPSLKVRASDPLHRYLANCGSVQISRDGLRQLAKDLGLCPGELAGAIAALAEAGAVAVAGHDQLRIAFPPEVAR
jgi:hypothetical protein